MFTGPAPQATFPKYCLTQWISVDKCLDGKGVDFYFKRFYAIHRVEDELQPAWGWSGLSNFHKFARPNKDQSLHGQCNFYRSWARQMGLISNTAFLKVYGIHLHLTGALISICGGGIICRLWNYPRRLVLFTCIGSQQYLLSTGCDLIPCQCTVVENDNFYYVRVVSQRLSNCPRVVFVSRLCTTLMWTCVHSQKVVSGIRLCNCFLVTLFAGKCLQIWQWTNCRILQLQNKN